MKYEDAALKVQAFVNVMAEEFELPPMVVVFDGRLSRGFGKAFYETQIIKLNPALIGTAQLEATTRHEVAHFYAWHKFGHTGHGEAWKTAARICGLTNPVARIDITQNAAAAEVFYANAKHRYVCAKGCKILRVRRLRRGLKYTCRKHGLLLDYESFATV